MLLHPVNQCCHDASVSIVFGDIEPDDAFDAGTVADPEQVAIRMQTLRYIRGVSPTDWSGLTHPERVVRIAIIAELFVWLREEGAVR